MIKLFTASWCQPCKLLKETLLREGITLLPEELVDVDSQMEYTKAVGVRSVPTLMLDDGTYFRSTAEILQEIIKYKESK